jgi:hypothetical protein
MPSRWERRLVGSTIATIPFVNRTAGRDPVVARRGLELLGLLVGDAEPDVQKALAWAYRSMAMIDPAATAVALEGEARLAAETTDGHRAWVIRDALTKLDPAHAARAGRAWRPPPPSALPRPLPPVRPASWTCRSAGRSPNHR